MTKFILPTSRNPFYTAIKSAAIVLLVNSFTIALLVILAYNSRRDTIRRDLLHAAVEAASMVDPKMHNDLRRPEQTGSPEYKKALAPLVRFHRANPHLYYVFTMVYENNDFYFILDTATDPSAPRLDENVESSAVYEKYEFTPEETKIIRRVVLEEMRPYTKDDYFIGTFGTFLTAFAPIVDEKGKCVGLAGVDYSLDSFTEMIGEVQLAAAFAWGVAMLISLFVAFSTWRSSADICKAEKALMKSEERYRGMFLNSGSAMMLLNPQTGHIIDANKAACEFYGYSLEEFCGMKMQEINQLSDYEVFEKMQSALNGVQRQFTFKHKTAGGVVKDVEVFSGPLELGDHTVLYSIIHDITEKIDMEEKLKQTEKMDAIGQLAGGIAHDFNNQLTGIVGYAQMLVTGLEDERMRYYAENVILASSRATDLTTQILAFARKGQFRKTPVDMHAAIDESIALLEHTLDRRITIRKELNARAHYVLGDPSQLSNALLNLAINARDAMPDGGVLSFHSDIVTLSEKDLSAFHEEPSVGTYLKLEVRDTGSGIDEAILDKIFDPFFTTKEKGKGTGIGLAAVYGTIKKHNGAINISTEKGKGTTFRIYLPICSEKPSMAQRTITTIPRADRPASILVIDDEPVVRRLLADMLESIGYTAICRENGKLGLDYYRENHDKVDLLIVDLMMPEVDGADVFESVMKINPKARVILCSGFSVEGMAQHLIDEGAADFVQKPFDQKILLGAVRTALSKDK